MSQTFPANYQSPFAVVLYDAASGNALGTSSGLLANQAANYTQITTAGTTTIKATAGLYYGAFAALNGTGTTSTTFFVLDGTTTLCGTSTVTAANQLLSPIPSGMSVKAATSILVVTAGTGVNLNVLWD